MRMDIIDMIGETSKIDIVRHGIYIYVHIHKDIHTYAYKSKNEKKKIKLKKIFWHYRVGERLAPFPDETLIPGCRVTSGNPTKDSLIQLSQRERDGTRKNVQP